MGVFAAGTCPREADAERLSNRALMIVFIVPEAYRRAEAKCRSHSTSAQGRLFGFVALRSG
jgi:hypothetical protein